MSNMPATRRDFIADTSLPAFLTQTGPHAYTLTFSASGAETYMLCPAMFCWSRVTGIEAATARAGANYGKAVHIGQAVLNRGGTLEKAFTAMARHFEENPQPASMRGGNPEWRTLARAKQALEAYCQWYSKEEWHVLGVEEAFEVGLGSFVMPGEVALQGNDIHVAVCIRGIRDLRVRWHDKLWIVDHKTMTKWSDLEIDKGKASFQFQMYAWVERLLTRQAADAVGVSVLTPVGGAIGNYLVAREPYRDPNHKPTARDLPRDQFERHPYPYTDAQLDAWRERAMRLARKIWDSWRAEEWDQYPTACAHWGKCEYYQLCWETDAAYKMAVAMSGDYRLRTPSPFEEDASE